MHPTPSTYRANWQQVPSQSNYFRRRDDPPPPARTPSRFRLVRHIIVSEAPDPPIRADVAIVPSSLGTRQEALGSGERIVPRRGVTPVDPSGVVPAVVRSPVRERDGRTATARRRRGRRRRRRRPASFSATTGASPFRVPVLGIARLLPRRGRPPPPSPTSPRRPGTGCPPRRFPRRRRRRSRRDPPPPHLPPRRLLLQSRLDRDRRRSRRPSFPSSFPRRRDPSRPPTTRGGGDEGAGPSPSVVVAVVVNFFFVVVDVFFRPSAMGGRRRRRRAVAVPGGGGRCGGCDGSSPARATLSRFPLSLLLSARGEGLREAFHKNIVVRCPRLGGALRRSDLRIRGNLTLTTLTLNANSSPAIIWIVAQRFQCVSIHKKAVD